MVSFDEMIAALDMNMPYYFKSQVVYDVEYNGSFFPWELNFNPYKNKGRMLPEQYALVRWEDNCTIIPASKGEEYLVEMLCMINECNEQSLVPVFFLYAFCKDMILRHTRGSSLRHTRGTSLRHTRGTSLRRQRSAAFQENVLCNDLFDLSELCLDAERILKENNYPLADPRYSGILPLYGDDYRSYRKTSLDVYKTTDELAIFIISLFQCIIRKFRLEHRHYSDEAYKAASKIKHLALEKMLSNVVNGQIYGNDGDGPDFN